ncbi:MAG: exodeoxyribonuclease VII small subunit [Anaerolineales bacterium]|jgi:exodeoxyribonuclease VII small subunit|nr:exodeoxyribonuclease VII small subunit [Anaerolineales bacterium]
MSVSSKNVEKMNFEEAFGELSGLVLALEEEGRPLDEAIGLYERGQSLALHCAALLEKAELKVRQLNGEILEEDEV